MKLLQKIITNSDFFNRIKDEIDKTSTIICNGKEHTIVCKSRYSLTRDLYYIDLSYIDEHINTIITARCHRERFGGDKYDITVIYKAKWFGLICEIIKYYDIYNYSYVLSVSEPLYSLKKDGYQLYPYSIQVSQTYTLDSYALSAEKRVSLANENGFCFKDIEHMNMNSKILSVYNGAIVYYGRQDHVYDDCAIFTIIGNVSYGDMRIEYTRYDGKGFKDFKNYDDWLYAIATSREVLGSHRFRTTKSARN